MNALLRGSVTDSFEHHTAGTQPRPRPGAGTARPRPGAGHARPERTRPRPASRRALSTIAWLALSALLATACAESAPTTQTGDLSPSQELQEMLDARANALASDDVAGYLEPLDPPAREVEEPIAEQAVDVPLSEIRLRLPDPTFSRREVDGEQVMVADNTKVDVVFRYEGIPEDNLFHFRLRSDFVERDGDWRVADSELVIPDPETPVPMPPMWALGPVEVARSEHFLAFHHPDLADSEALLALAEEAREELLPKLTLEPASAHVLQLARDDGEYQQITDPTASTSSIALADMWFPSPDYAASRVPQSRQMTVNVDATLATDLPPEAVVDPEQGDDAMADPDDGDDHRYESDTTPREVFQHELGHLALGRFTRGSTPVWVKEGGAMELAGEERMRSWRAGLADGTFEEMSFLDLARRDPIMGLAPMEYAYVNAAVSSLVDEFGAERFWEFYRNFKEFEMGSAGTPLEQTHADATNRLLFRTYDMGEETLDQRALDWMRQATNQT